MAQLIMSLVASSTSPEEVLWISEFAAELNTAAKYRRWTTALNWLIQLHVQRPGHCTCDIREQRDWSHQFHGEYNRRIRGVIDLVPGARAGLHKALYRDLHGPLLEGDAAFGRISHREGGKLVLDFLRARPAMEWFR